MEEPLNLLHSFLVGLGFGQATGFLIAQVLLVFGIILLCVLANTVAKRLVLRFVKYLIEKSSFKWDDALLRGRVFDNIAHLAPALVVYGLTPLVFPYFPELQVLLGRLVISYFIFIGSLVASALLNVIVESLATTDFGRERPVKVYAQVLKILIGLVAAILIFATILDRSPWALLSGLGAMTAIIMLVFKDSILGFVASVHLTNNDMVRRGDWIEMPKYNADGDVLDVTLTSVKVQNFDKTISTIPTYALVSDSFKNWRGMSSSGVRRIKRDIVIDINSISFCSKELLNELKEIKLLEAYLDKCGREISAHNSERGIERSHPGDVNGRALTNIGVFRAYVLEYLKSLPTISSRHTLLVRQLQATDTGLPLQLYCFSTDTRWAHYEAVQSDIFDHLIAVLPAFKLKAFQLPTGFDLRKALLQ